MLDRLLEELTAKVGTNTFRVGARGWRISSPFGYVRLDFSSVETAFAAETWIDQEFEAD